MKKNPNKKSHSSAFDFAVGAALASIITNTVFALSVWLSRSMQATYVFIDVGLLMLFNVVCLVMIVIMHKSFNRKLKTKIAQPLKQVKTNLDKLMSGDFAKPEIDDKESEMSEIYESLESIRQMLEDYGEKQRASRESKNIYVSGLMHDIATPITRISGCASMINDGIVTSEADIKKFAEMIIQNTEDINIMLKNLAEIEKYDYKVIHNHMLPINLSSVIGRYTEDLKLEFKGRNVKISFVDLCNRAPVCLIDVKSCKRVLMNLINNSIKYKKPDADCEIVLGIETNSNDEAVVTVADNGVGIENGTQEMVFDMFYRGDRVRQNISQGNGVGLFVSKEIVEHNNGKIWAENNGNGLTVYVSFPLSKEPAVEWF